MPENALMAQKKESAFITNLYAQKENWSSNLERKDEKAMLTLVFSIVCL